jgi:hypothetical protein
VEFTRVRITLSRTTGAALDTVVDFPPGADSLVLALLVPITGSSETFALTLAMINAAGDTVFRGGPVPATATAGVVNQPAPVSVTVRYVGVGSNAASVRIAPRAASVFFGDTTPLAATAFDSSGAPIPGTPIVWRSLDAGLAHVAADTSGRVIGGAARGVARIEAALLTARADTALVTVQPLPAAVSVLSGGSQTGPVGALLPQPVAVRVKASDSLGVAGVVVDFAVAGGTGAVTSAVDTSDANGDVTTSWTLGSTLGAQTLVATVPGSPGLTATIGATAVVGPPTQLAFTVQPSNVAANTVMAPAPQVVAQDSFGHAVTSFTGNVTLSLGANPGGAALGGTLTVGAVAGVATFGDLALTLSGTGYTLVAASSGLASATSASFGVSGGVATQLAFVQQPSGASAGTAITPAVTVEGRDANGNVVPTFTGDVTVAITGGTGTAGATLSGTKTVTAVAGVATFAGLAVDKAGTGYTLTATASGPASATSAAFDVAAGAASQLAFTTQPVTTTAGVRFGVVVTARDSVGNTAGTFTGNVALAITGGTGRAGAALRGTTTVAAVAGVATFSGLSVDSAGTGYTLTATASGAGAATSASFAVTAAPASRLAFSVEPPANVATGAAFAVAVAARDSLGNAVTSFTGSVSVAIVANPASGTLTGALSHNAVSGVAAFGGLSIDNIGSGYTLGAGATGLASATSAPFNVLASGNVNAWINPAGGDWSVAANWSRGAVPGPLDTVTIAQSGTYTVNVDVNATFARLDVGAPSGTQTLAVAANTLTAGNGAFASNTVLSLSGSGTITGSGSLAVSGAFDWTGGNLGGASGAGGGIRVLTGASLAIAPAASVSFQGYTLEVGGTGSWAGTATVSAGSGAVLRVLGGATLDIQGDPVFAFDLGGATPALNVLGTLTRTSSLNPAVIGVALNDSGTVSIQSGTLRLGGGGASSGAYAVSAGATLDFSGGTHTLASTSGISGAGTVSVSGGALSAAGPYALTGATHVSGGAANFNGASGSTAALTISGGSLGGSGLLTVGGAMSWTGGNLSGAAGTTRVLAGGTLSLAPAANVDLQSYTLELAGTGTWSGTATMNTGGGAVLRVLSGGTLDIQGNPTFTFSLGGASSLVENLGTVNRTTSAGTVTFLAPFNLGGTVSIQSGAISVAGGGTMTGAVTLASATLLQFTGGSTTLANNFRVTGTSGITQIGGLATVGGLAPTDTAFFDNLQLAGGTIALAGGTIKTPLSTTWAGGAAFGGGTLFIPTGATLALSFTGQASLQNATILNAGTAVFAGTGELRSGSGAVIRNLPAANFAFSAAGSYAYNLGGTPSVLDNQGTITSAPVSGNFLVSAQLTNTGTILVANDTLRFTGGSNGNLTGSVSATGAAALELGGGTFTQSGPLQVTGNLVVSAGLAVPNGHPLSVTGTFATASTGALQMTLPADSVEIGGNATFGGGTGTLSNGVIRVAGNFTQTGGASFAPGPTTSPQRVVLTGNTGQILSFANPTLSFFRRLQAAQGANGAISLADTTRASWFQWLSNTSMPGPGGHLIADTVTGSPVATSITVNKVEVSSLLNTSGLFQPDTAVFTGASQLIPNQYGYHTIRVAQSGGTAAFAGNLGSALANLVVSSGTLDLTGRQVAVSGLFRTEGTGALRMTGAADSLGVGGNATFGGGSTTGLLTNGVISVGGNFSQGGGASDAFAPGTAERVLINNGAGALQTVSFANPTQSFFDSLIVNRGFSPGTVQLLTDIRVNRGMTLANSSNVTGSTARATIAGGTLQAVQSTTSPTMTNLAIELSTAPLIGGSPVKVSPDTMVYDGTIASLPTGSGIVYNSVRVNTLGTMTVPGNVALAKDLVVSSGGLSLNRFGVVVAGNFRTEASGVLVMTSPTDSLGVGGNATFGGGSTAGLLTGGLISVNGNFAQTGSASAYAPTLGATHRLVLQGPGAQSISFANPGSSFFDVLAVASTGARSVVLQTNVVVNDTLYALGGGSPTSIVGAGTSQRLTVNGILRVTQQTTSPLVAPPVLELAAFPAIDSIFSAGAGVSPDTLVLLPGITTVPVGTPIHLGSLRASTNGLVTLDDPAPNRPDTLAGALTVDGTTILAISEPTDPLVVMGNLATAGSGVLQMQTAGSRLVVNGSATFAGGSTESQLTQGSLFLAGNLTQAGNAAAFAPGAGFSTFLTGTTPAGQQVTFANPGLGTGTSHFSFVQINNVTGPITLNSNVFATVTLADTSIGGETITGTAATVLTAEGVFVNNFKINGAPLVVLDTATETAFQMASVTFSGYDPTVDQLTVKMRGDLSASTTGAVFGTPPTIGVGHYLNLQWIAAGPLGGPPVLTMNSATPAGQGGTSTVIAVTGSFGTPTIVWQ